MSKLIVRGHNGAEFKLSVTQFRSPMSATINTVQTRRMTHHFPIRAGQPDIQFTAHFPSQDEKHEFQNFVRDHQLNALDDKYTNSTTSSGAVTLLWPERDINSWTGYIVNVPVQEVRFDYAPKLTFGVMLIKSLMSDRTFASSLGSGFDNIFGVKISPYVPDAEDIANWFQLPTVPVAQQARQVVEETRSVTERIINGFGRLFG
jgi:hypothetical protein